LVGEADFDDIFGRLRERGLSYWADPAQTEEGQINHHDGGRGVYFEDPNGHLMEIITRPYGSGGWNPSLSCSRLWFGDLTLESALGQKRTSSVSLRMSA